MTPERGRSDNRDRLDRHPIRSWRTARPRPVSSPYRWRGCGSESVSTPSSDRDRPTVWASATAERMMPSTSRPTSASCSSRSACSTNRSGSPRRRTCVEGIPASLAASSTAEPKPPIRQPSSTVRTNAASSRALQTVARSSGLMNRALTTPTRRPWSSRSCSAARTQAPSMRAAGQDHAVGLPLEDLGLAQLDGLGSRSTTSRLARG